MMRGIHFLEPGVLRPLLIVAGICFLLWICLVAYKRIKRPRRTRGSKYPFLGKERFWLFVVLAFAVMVVAYARPYTKKEIPVTKSGCIELIIALDVSVSMLANDLGESRFDVAKKELAKVYKEKILDTDCDRISFFPFDGAPRVAVFYSRDHDRFLSKLEEVSIVENLLSGDESPWHSDVTAVLEKIRSVRDSQEVFFKRYYPENVHDISVGRPESRTIVLLVTDGDIEIADSARQKFSDAVEALREQHLKIYGLGVGTARGTRLLNILSYPQLQGHIKDSIVVKLNEEWKGLSTHLDTRLLDVIAGKTGGAVSVIAAKDGGASDFLQRIVSANRPKTVSIEKAPPDTGRELWWYVLNGAVILLLFGILVA